VRICCDARPWPGILHIILGFGVTAMKVKALGVDMPPTLLSAAGEVIK